MFLQVFSLLFLLFQCNGEHESPTKSYIVYLGTSKGMEASQITETHHDILARAVGSIESAESSLLYSYKYAFSGFSARLTQEQADTISRMPEVLNIFPSKTLRPLTTHSWDFLSMPIPSKNTPNQSPNAPSDVVVGLLDTGIWPESDSFKDSDMGQVPARWKGTCVNPPGTKANETVNCNKKLIGARYYNKARESESPYKNARDSVGHGTHTSSTAAGSLVPHASKRGLASGTARGGAPGAFIAMYKVCWTDSCEEADIAAAFDDAISDGVDVLSISLGGFPEAYSVDVIAIGSYHAVERGVMVSCAAGNDGPYEESVTNGAPWIFTVGASTIDRKVDDGSKIVGRRTGVLRGTTIPYKPAPVVAEFSSRGPNSISPDIIKPDVTAPGVEILAAWPSNISDFDGGKEVYVAYTFLSGTSMACPHVSGTIAYIKSIHPTWSPAAIKSAVMTTASTTDNSNETITDPSNGKPADVFDIGSGEIQPAKAADPGLVYDTDPLDYILYLCNSGYTSKQIQNITGDTTSKCPGKNDTSFSLNYPSISVLLDSSGGSKTVKRTVTNVGDASSVYTANLGSAKGFSISVSPSKLSFTSTGQKLSYSITVAAKGSSRRPQAPSWSFSDLTWTDGTHSVRSPIACVLNSLSVIVVDDGIAGGSLNGYKSAVNGDHGSSTKVYIVYLGTSKGMMASQITEKHRDILTRAVGSIEAAESSILYSYKYAFSGFSARLTQEQADTISRMPEVLNIFPSKTLHLQTTHSWDFLGMPMPSKNTPNQSPSAASDVVVGLLDSGIWPESDSFKDSDMGPVPARWKGTCVNPPGTNANETVNCNKKLIGARYYNKAHIYDFPYENARDADGHGTHTSSTVAGSLVPHASKQGLAKGTARGGAPGAFIAMYKVCWSRICEEADIAAAFDDAINDGVDVLSISLGGQPKNYSVDVIAIGSYHAVERGITVSCAAGNGGPSEGSVANGAPWIFTVGASTIDRKVDDGSKMVGRKSGILQGTIIPYKPAPVIANFSARGPNSISPDIIKPDVTAPGVEVLAAWPNNIPDLDGEKEVYVSYNFLSGTSMACPHVSGTVAYIKSMHPTWSPAAIKSAVMTTAITGDNANETITDPSDGKPADIFDIGSGEIQPAKAADPGLVYDIDPLDYITYLCNSGYTSKQLQNITSNSTSKCPGKNDESFSLNYPSIAVLLDSSGGSKTVERTVTNVGDASSVYTAKLGSAKGLSISVSPSKLSFTSTGQKLSYSVTVAAQGSSRQSWRFSDLTWNDGTHSVRSPIAVRT